MNRRNFLRLATGTMAAAGPVAVTLSRDTDKDDAFRLRYMLASSMYGDLPLAEILPEVEKVGAQWIDLWPKVHGTQREQVEEMGHDAFGQLLEQHRVKLGCSTRYDLGPFALQDEIKFVSKFGGDTIVCGGKGPKGLQGEALKKAVQEFADKLRPHADAAQENGVRIAIENHGSNLINTPDSLKWLRDFTEESIAIALAVYHLEDGGLDANGLAELVKNLGQRIAVFYAWQHGKGCFDKLPKEEELLQMPGRGSFDFGPVISAFREIDYQGYTEIFMHPVPQGCAHFAHSGRYECRNQPSTAVSRFADLNTTCLSLAGNRVWSPT